MVVLNGKRNNVGCKTVNQTRPNGQSAILSKPIITLYTYFFIYYYLLFIALIVNKDCAKRQILCN